MDASPLGAVPSWIRIGWTAFVVVWVPTYVVMYGASNFLWICDLSCFVLLAGLWARSRLLVSTAAVGALVPCSGFVVDLAGRALLGFHPIGGTEFMWDRSLPFAVRMLSLFHVALLPLLVFLVRRMGYDGRALALQTALTWSVLLVGFVALPAANLNFVVHPPGGREWLSGGAWLAVALVVYPVLLHLPTHAWLRRGPLAERTRYRSRA